MRNFFRVAAVILFAAAGVYLYELTGGEVVPAKQTVQAVKPARAVAVSKSPPVRIRAQRAIDRSRPLPRRPAGLEGMIEARGGSDFPVLIPPRFMQDAAASKRYDVRLHLTDDGYTSVLTLPDYDVVIYGTRSAFRKPEILRAEAEAMQASAGTDLKKGPATGQTTLPPVRRDYVMRFEDSDDGRGGSLSFGRYGVDYHIEFHCRGDAENCINAASAGVFLADMFAEKAIKEHPRFKIELKIGGSTQSTDNDVERNTDEGETRP